MVDELESKLKSNFHRYNCEMIEISYDKFDTTSNCNPLMVNRNTVSSTGFDKFVDYPVVMGHQKALGKMRADETRARTRSIPR